MTFMFSTIRTILRFSLLVTLLGLSMATLAGPKKTGEKEICPLLVSETIPDITLKSNKGEDISLHAIAKKAPTLFVFYRGGWCPYCNTHLSELRKIESELKSMGVQIVAISPDTVENLGDTIEKNELAYTLLSDSKMMASKAFGLAYKVDDKTMKKLKGYGIDIEKSSGESHGMLPVPAAILVNDDLLAHFVYAAPDYKIRVNKDVVLAAAKAMVETK